MPRSIGAICLFLAAFTATTHSGGLFGTGGVHAESDRACPKVTEGLRSKNVDSKSVVVKFVGFTGYPVDLYWVDWNGSEGQREELFPGSASERRTFPGHVFRARQSGSGVLLTEFTADSRGKQIVRIEPCDKAKEAYKVEDWTPRDIDLSLVHDQAAPCEPAGKSSQWSCVRKIPPEDVAARNKEQYGFQEADALESNRECARERNLFDTTDNGYSNKNHRLQVSRVTQGPGYLKMSYDPELFKLLTGWAKNHSSYWHHENPVSRVDYDNTESIAGCYANTHAFPFAILNMDHHPRVRRAVVSHLQQVLEWWTRRRLEHTSTYGMRIYRREAMLVNHVDREDTHIASAVIQVWQDTDEDGGWPLEVVGEDDIVREVYLQPGEMVLYEGARLLHGRPMRFKGNHFGNIFSHFKPRMYTNHLEDDL